MVSKFIKRGTNMANEKEHGNIGQFWKGTEANKDPLLWKTLTRSEDCALVFPPK